MKGIRVHSSPNQFRFPRLHRHQKFTQTRHVPQQPKFRLMLGQRGFRFKHPIAQRFDLRRGPLDVSRDQGVPAIRLKRSVLIVLVNVRPPENKISNKKCLYKHNFPSDPTVFSYFDRGTGNYNTSTTNMYHQRRFHVPTLVQQPFEKDTGGGIFPQFNLLRLTKHKQRFGTGPSHARQIIQGRSTGVLGAGVVQLHRRRHFVQCAVVLAHRGA